MLRDAIAQGRIDVSSEEKATAYFSAVAVVMSNQVRSVVERSLCQFRDFFMRFDFAKQASKLRGRRRSSYSASLTKTLRPAFNVQLTISDGQIKFASSAEEILSAVMGVFDRIITVLAKLPRVEHYGNGVGLDVQSKNSLAPSLPMRTSSRKTEIKLRASSKTVSCLPPGCSVPTRNLKICWKQRNLFQNISRRIVLWENVALLLSDIAEFQTS